MYTDTITLFNRYESRTGDTWYATIIAGVNLTIDKASIIAKYGPESQDNAMLNIKYILSNDGDIIVSGKKWLPPKEWDMQTNDRLSDTLTFSGGTEFDFFYVGAWDGALMISDDDYSASGGFYNYINNRYDYVFAINSVSSPYKLIPHFEIMAK